MDFLALKPKLDFGILSISDGVFIGGVRRDTSGEGAAFSFVRRIISKTSFDGMGFALGPLLSFVEMPKCPIVPATLLLPNVASPSPAGRVKARGRQWAEAKPLMSRHHPRA